MKIKEFDEKVRIGSQISFNGMVYVVVDIDRRTHEAIVGKAAIRIRCSEFELYTGGKDHPYVESDAHAKMGRPTKPVTAIFKNGITSVFDSVEAASDALDISIYSINKVLYGKAKHAKGIRFRR